MIVCDSTPRLLKKKATISDVVLLKTFVVIRNTFTLKGGLSKDFGTGKLFIDILKVIKVSI